MQAESTCVYCQKKVTGPFGEGWHGVQKAHIEKCSTEMRAEIAELRSKFSLTTETPNYQSRLNLREEIIRLRDENAVKKDSQYALELRAIIAAVRHHNVTCSQVECAQCNALDAFDRRLV